MNRVYSFLPLLLALQFFQLGGALPATPVLASLEARRRWLAVLAENQWDRSHPAVELLGDQLTTHLLSVLPNAGPAEAQVRLTLNLIAANALATHLRNAESPDPQLLLGYLRHHDDDVLEAQLHRIAGATGQWESVSVVQELARVGRSSIAIRLANVVNATASWGERDSRCRDAIALSATARRSVSEVVAPALAALGPAELPDNCIFLLGQSIPGRQLLAEFLARPVSQPPRTSTRAIAALFLVDGPHHRTALRMLQQTRDGTPGFSRELVARGINNSASIYSQNSPTLTNFFLRFITDYHEPNQASALVLPLLRFSEHTQHQRWERVLAHREYLSPAAVLLYATTAPQAEQHLSELSFSSPRMASTIRHAIQQTGRCSRNLQCLANLLPSPSDEIVAARALWLLGRAGIEALSGAHANGLVHRILVNRETFVLTMLVLRTGTCPRPLRMLREWPRTETVPDIPVGSQLMVQTFLNSCVEQS